MSDFVSFTANVTDGPDEVDCPKGLLIPSSLPELSTTRAPPPTGRPGATGATGPTVRDRSRHVYHSCLRSFVEVYLPVIVYACLKFVRARRRGDFNVKYFRFFALQCLPVLSGVGRCPGLRGGGT